MVLCCVGLQCDYSSSSPHIHAPGEKEGEWWEQQHQVSAPCLKTLWSGLDYLLFSRPCFLGRWGRCIGMLTAGLRTEWQQSEDTPIQMLLVPSQASERHIHLCDEVGPSLSGWRVCGRPTSPSCIGCCQGCFHLIFQEQICLIWTSAFH